MSVPEAGPAPTCERLDAGAFKESGRAVLVVPVVVPAVVDRVGAAAVLLLQIHVLVLGGHRRHHDWTSAETSPHQRLLTETCRVNKYTLMSLYK